MQSVVPSLAEPLGFSMLMGFGGVIYTTSTLVYHCIGLQAAPNPRTDSSTLGSIQGSSGGLLHCKGRPSRGSLALMQRNVGAHPCSVLEKQESLFRL